MAYNSVEYGHHYWPYSSLVTCTGDKKLPTILYLYVNYQTNSEYMHQPIIVDKSINLNSIGPTFCPDISRTCGDFTDSVLPIFTSAAKFLAHTVRL